MLDPSFHALLDLLAERLPPADVDGFPREFSGWWVERVTLGFNNLLFHARGPSGDYAVKFARRDARDRAGREFNALAVLHAACPGLAPAPVLLERDRYAFPLVVTTWLAGESRAEAPSTPEEWRRLAEHYAALHKVTPLSMEPAQRPLYENNPPQPEPQQRPLHEDHQPQPVLKQRPLHEDHPPQPLPPAVLTFSTPPAAVAFVLAEAARLAPGAMRPELADLLARLEQSRFPDVPLPAQPLALDRCDPSLFNFLRRPGPWASVDWEYAGWGDPAFEIGDLTTHPHFHAVPPPEMRAFLELSAALHPSDPNFLERATTFAAILLARWAVVFARYWWDRDHAMPVPARLSAPPAAWWENVPNEYARYLQLAEVGLGG